MIYNTLLIEEINKRFSNGQIVKRDENPYFRGEVGVKKAFLTYSYTEEELNEIIKCKVDINYFVDKYCKINTSKGVSNIKLRGYQKDYLNQVENNKFVLHLKSREIGSVLMNAIKMIHYGLFNVDKNIVIIANVTDTSIEIIDKIKDIYLNLPFFLKCGVKNWNQTSIKFDNGCRIMAKTAKNAAIGFTIDFCLIEEFGHISPKLLNNLYTCLFPIMSAIRNSKLIISSTPNGNNLLYDLYLNAREDAEPSKKNSFKLIETPYYVVEGRDSKWVEERIKDYGVDLFDQEYNLKFLEKNNKIKKSIEKNVDPVIERLDRIEKMIINLLNKNM